MTDQTPELWWSPSKRAVYQHLPLAGYWLISSEEEQERRLLALPSDAVRLVAETEEARKDAEIARLRDELAEAKQRKAEARNYGVKINRELKELRANEQWRYQPCSEEPAASEGTEPKVGDRAEYAGEDGLITGHVVELGKPEHREAVIEDDETGDKSWHLFDDIEVIRGTEQ